MPDDEPQPAPATLGAAAESLVIRPLPGDRGLALEGEADTNGRQALQAALRNMARAGLDGWELDLAGLRFIDVSCTREIIEAIERLRPARVRLRHPPRAFRRIAGCLRQEPMAGTTRPESALFPRSGMPMTTRMRRPRRKLHR